MTPVSAHVAARDYWWRCDSCPGTFERLLPTVRYVFWGGRRQKRYDTDCAAQHEADNPGHRCTRKLAPGV